MTNEQVTLFAEREAQIAAHVAFTRALAMEGCPEENFWYALEDFEAERLITDEFRAGAKEINSSENHEELWELYDVVYNNVVYTELVRYKDLLDD